MKIMNKVTWKGLKKNKTRTIVTIIGVILSTAMITAVTTFISSLQNYAVEYTIMEEGRWHGAFYDVGMEEYDYLKKDEQIEDVALIHAGGYARLEDSINEYKPYLRLLELDEKAFEMLPIHMVSGRLPENENEVIISEHIQTNGGVMYQVGDELTLELGQRIAEDGSVLQDAELIVDENNVPMETIRVDRVDSYTVVGICKRLSREFEAFSEPGYTVIKKAGFENKAEDTLRAYIIAKNPKKIIKMMERIADEKHLETYRLNNDVLRYMGISKNENFNKVLYNLGGILIVLIMIGSVSLIYNSFSISISERTKQFGLLSTAGATARQRRNSVFYESLVIAAIGIPIGILSGIAGIGTTLYLLRNQFKDFLFSEYSTVLTVSVSFASVIIAAVLAMMTILISAYIPARRSMRMSAIDAIRQTADVKLTAKKVRTSKLTRILFGMEGEIALKNFKRNKRRYRSTIISLFISVVLFISASAFGMYLKDSVTNVYEDAEYDITYSSYQNNKEERKLIDKNVFRDILEMEGIRQGSIVKSASEVTRLKKEQIDKDHYQRMIEYGMSTEGDELTVGIDVHFVDHVTYMDYQQKLGLSSKEPDTQGEPSGILVDRQHFYNPVEQRYNNTHILNDKNLDSLSIYYSTEEQEEIILPIRIKAFADYAPFGVTDYTYNNAMILILDEELLSTDLPQFNSRWYMESMYIAAQNPLQAGEKIKERLTAGGMTYLNVYNIAEELQSVRNIILVISVFTYGFITLISLIAIANVFNTVSTNMHLRQREFAMLKSIGMTSRSFYKMLNYECIFYGLKALLYGLPVSIGITYLIFRSVENGVDMGFYLPVQSIFVAVFSVFFVVFITMMYSMDKIRKGNILEALKKE